MSIDRRALSKLACAAFAVATLSCGTAAALDYPVRPIRMIVPFPAGSGPDVVARVLGQYLGDALGQSVIIDDKPGAQGIIAATAAAHSPPDGYTLFLTTNTTQAANAALFKTLAYDPIKDFAPIGRVILTPLVMLVRPDFPARDIQEFVTYAQNQPNGLAGAYGSSASQIANAKLKTVGHFSVVNVPYPGTPPAMNDLMAGQVAFTFVDLAAGSPLLRAGSLKSLGVTASKRLAFAPDLPAIAEVYPGFELTSWGGLMAPAGTPREIVDKVYGALAAVLAKPEVRDRIWAMNIDIAPLDPDAFAVFIKDEIAKWAQEVKAAGIEPQ